MTGTVVWITGPPSSGKSTFARRARKVLELHGKSVALLDSDEVRASLERPLGYGADDRAAFYTLLAERAAALAGAGAIVLVAATAHRRDYRQRARRLAPRFIEVYVDTPLAECARRDDKGLYRAAASGHVDALPGVNVGYEPPRHPDVVASGGLDNVALARLLRLLVDAEHQSTAA